MSQRSVLVTGGFGYIGGRLCRYLANQDQTTVVAMSRRPDADWPAGEYKQPQVRVCDLADRNRDLNEITEGVDAIVHLVALDAAASADNPVAAIDLNTTATMRLLQSAAATGVKRFIYVSTIHVYRSPLEGAIDESSIAEPRHIYAITHRAAEDLVLAHGSDQMEVVVVRLSNAVGPPNHEPCNCWHLVANDLCRQAVVDRVLVLKSAGYQQRDFVPMSDVVSGLNHLLRLRQEPLGHRVFNLGGNRSLSIRELAILVVERSETLLGYSPKLDVPDGSPHEAGLPFTFSSERIEQTGFDDRSQMNDEIDACLRYCARNFSAKDRNA